MDLQKKIELLGNFDENEIYKIIEDVFNSRGLENIERFDTSILKGEQGTLLGTKKEVLVYIYDSKLSAISEFETKSITETLTNLYEQYHPSEFYLISKTPISNKVTKSLIAFLPNIQLVDRDSLIDLIDKTNKEIWKKGNPYLINYEKYILDRNRNIGIDLKSLPFYNDKYQKLLDVYIEPSLHHYFEDPKTKTLIRERGTIDSCIKEKQPIIFSGQAGTGKSTLLKKIGEQILAEPFSKGKKKKLPVFITIGNILDSNYASIKTLVILETSKHLPYINFDELIQEYQITIIIDSLDELEKENQEKIIAELDDLYTQNNIKFIIASRDQEKLLAGSTNKNIQKYTIQNFNITQIQRFISSFFLGENMKAENLIDALKENRILDRLPLNPLTLSLISILYEENNFEIPATITDIYNNFSSLVLGRFSVQSRVEFIDISFKERILSIYALALMESQEHRPFLITDFYTFFEKYYSNKTAPIKDKKIKDILDFIINHTGILIINENNRVQFTHDSYMEYYAALEIFKHQRAKDEALVSNFFDPNWQNVAIFFAGLSKDMPDFLQKVLKKVSEAKLLPELHSSVYGSGYLLQALFQTDNKLRSNVIEQALDNNIRGYEIIRNIAENEQFIFKGYSLPILLTMNLMFFYESFNSITLKSPLELTFDSLFAKYENEKDITDGFKLLNLAFVLESKRLNSPKFLEKIIENKDIMSTPELYAILNSTLTAWGEPYADMKKELQKNYGNKITEPVRELLRMPAKKLRFSKLNTIGDKKSIKLIVEGETDAIIIEYAYRVLTGGENPYWEIRPAGNLANAGVIEISKCLMSINSVVTQEQIIIGVFDHDSAGLREYGALKNNVFDEKEPFSIKKHKEKYIYGLLLPIPGEMSHYKKERQELNYFAIEHYFGHDYLKSHNILQDSGINDIYAIKDKAKKSFSQQIIKENNPKVFEYFLDLFNKIDEISGIQKNYLI